MSSAYQPILSAPDLTTWIYAALFFLPPQYDRIPTSKKVDPPPPAATGRRRSPSSLSRHAALSPARNLHYDLRCVPNPPGETRARKIRDSLLREPRYRELLEAAEADIRGAMRAVAREEARGGEDIALRVGCLCGSGHDRSVAFSEQLAMVEWPGDWQLELRHCDLTPGVKRQKAWERRKR
ncbi:hypothetical protein F4820DRAFT_465904 [Hypoxylon rubiginosum]|uniref:Uncharacterized protein n=1 Tax=Hypoxylon rubiginosum TaxID=110542 RepID=A0ACB9YML0_9PEZI|nr:hypothetical protein F4820DRAFT_465904 [Hypoxylon rubiginosum]